MSTKIYTGFELQLTPEERPHPLTALMARTARFRTLILPLAHTALNQWFVRQLFYQFDHEQFFQTLSNSPKPQSPYDAAYSEYHKGHDNLRNGRRAPEIDMNFEVTYFPYQNRIFGIYYSENRTFSTLWMAQPGMDDYHYQNSTDRPDTISETAWTARRLVWDTIFDRPDATPALRGLSTTILPQSLSPEFGTFRDTYLKYAPPFDTRTREIGYQIALNRLMKAPFSFEEFHRVERLLKSPAYQNMLISDITTAHAQLIPTPAFTEFLIEPPHRLTHATS